jgi:ATP-dependent Clp protease ATP-binding subunit ClpC
MNYNLTDRVRKVLATAREAAIGLQHDHVGTEHILLALLDDERSLVTAAFDEVDPAFSSRLRRNLARSGKRAAAAPGEIRYTGRAFKALAFAAQESVRLGDAHVDAMHVGLGILRHPGRIVAETLSGSGMSPEGLFADLTARLYARAGQGNHVSPTPVTAAAVAAGSAPSGGHIAGLANGAYTGKLLARDIVRAVIPYVAPIILALAVLVGSAVVDVASAVALIANGWYARRSAAPELPGGPAASGSGAPGVHQNLLGA